MNRTDRLYAIVEELRHARSGGRTAAGLADQFEVHPRTIKRDISALQQAGTPIWSQTGPGGGYVIDASATLPPLTFTPGEATAVALALGADRGQPFGPDGRSALTKVMGAMAPDARRAAEALASRIWRRGGRSGSSRSSSATVIDRAMRDGVVVVLDYVDADGHRTTRRPVEPMLLARNDDHWYLLAWCRRRRGGRWFRLDRIAAAHLTTEAVRQRDVAAVFGAAPDDAAPVSLG